MWKKELIKDVKYMESLYMDHESFKKDFEIAKKQFKQERINKIRGKNNGETIEKVKNF